MKKLWFTWEEMTSTFWFVPSLIILISIAAALGLIYLDSRIDFQDTSILQSLLTGSADSARSVLSTISGAMIGVAGTVFSITLVTLTLASSQFGSRLLRNFMHERLNQIVLGTYISTYVYCLIVLNSVKENAYMSFVPNLSVFVAILAAVANIILLIVFIHHVAFSLQADKVISDIYESLSRSIESLFSEEMGEDTAPPETPDLDAVLETYSHTQVLTAARSGYLQYLDHEALFQSAIKDQQLIHLRYRSGNYLVRDMPIGTIYAHEKIAPHKAQRIQGSCIIGKVRTPLQDAEFSIHQMVEIADRALSPGINDPYTAIACIDNLTSTMCYLTSVKFPHRYRYDEGGDLRLVTEVLTFRGMLNAAFNQIRLMEALILIHQFARNAEQRQAIEHHAKMVLRVAESSFEEAHDLADMKERSRQIVSDES